MANLTKSNLLREDGIYFSYDKPNDKENINEMAEHKCYLKVMNENCVDVSSFHVWTFTLLDLFHLVNFWNDENPEWKYWVSY